MIRRWWHRQVGHPRQDIRQCRVLLGWWCSSCDEYLGTATVTEGERTRPRTGWPR